MPRSPQKPNRWRVLTAWTAFAVFVSFMLVQAGAQGRRMQPGTAQNANQQARRKNIASVRSTDTTDTSRVTITSDVPLNDYAAYWSGNRYYVVIPEADLVTRDVLGLQNSLRGAGYEDVRIEKKGNDVVLSFGLRPGMRARVEQRFNRLDVLFTAPPGVVFNPNQNRNTYGTRGNGTTTGNRQGNTSGSYQTSGNTGRTGNTSGTGGGTSGTGISGGATSGTTSGAGGTGGTSSASSGSGGGGGSRRTGRPRYGSGGSSGYSGGGGDRGGGAPLNIPLPSDIQASASPTPASPTATTSPIPGASPATGDATAQTNTSPTAASSPTPEQIAQNNPQTPGAVPPGTTSTTTTNAPSTAPSNTSFAAAIRENWLPLLIGLVVLAAIVLLIASRSRADRGEGRGPERRLETKKTETLKEKPASRTGAAVAGGAAGAAAGTAAVAAIAKDRAKTAPAKEPVETKEEAKAIEPVAPSVEMERIGTEVKGLLEGKDYDEAIIGSSNPETRQIVSTELLAALASRNPERRLRAREAFNKHGFFDEATQKLRTSGTAAERISAARALGLTQDQASTPHLVAALEDDDPEVRRASVNALAELRDPSAIGPLNALLEREKNRKVPHSLIRRAIEASATIDLPDTSAATTAAPTEGATATSAEKKDKDDDDREVFEI